MEVREALYHFSGSLRILSNAQKNVNSCDSVSCPVEVVPENHAVLPTRNPHEDVFFLSEHSFSVDGPFHLAFKEKIEAFFTEGGVVASELHEGRFLTPGAFHLLHSSSLSLSIH